MASTAMKLRHGFTIDEDGGMIINFDFCGSISCSSTSVRIQSHKPTRSLSSAQEGQSTLRTTGGRSNAVVATNNDAAVAGIQEEKQPFYNMLLAADGNVHLCPNFNGTISLSTNSADILIHKRPASIGADAVDQVFSGTSIVAPEQCQRQETQGLSSSQANTFQETTSWAGAGLFGQASAKETNAGAEAPLCDTGEGSRVEYKPLIDSTCPWGRSLQYEAITAMEEYSDASLEELRWADYNLHAAPTTSQGL